MLHAGLREHTSTARDASMARGVHLQRGERGLAGEQVHLGGDRRVEELEEPVVRDGRVDGRVVHHDRGEVLAGLDEGGGGAHRRRGGCDAGLRPGEAYAPEGSRKKKDII